MPTQRVDLTDGDYTDLGPGPMYVHIPQLEDVRLHFGGSKPVKDSIDFLISNGPAGQDYQGSENVYARATRGSAHVVVVTEAV